MAVSYLGFSDADFWEASPRKICGMIDSWRLIERERAYYVAALTNGQSLDSPSDLSREAGDDLFEQMRGG